MKKSEDGEYLVDEHGAIVAKWQTDLKAYFLLRPSSLTDSTKTGASGYFDKMCFHTQCRMACVETNAQGKCIAWEKVCETVAADCPEPPIG